MLLRYAGFVDFGLSEGEGTALCDRLAVPASSTFVVLAERNIQLALAGKAALVGSFAYDTDTEIMQISEGYAAIHGFPEGTVEKARSECLADVHPDDIGQVTQLRSEAFRERRREYKRGVSYLSCWWRGALGRDALLHYL